MSPMKMRPAAAAAAPTRVNRSGDNGTNKANKRRPEAVAQMDANWPVKCICNLCQCGQHRCSNFGLDEQLAALQANSSAAMNYQANELQLDNDGDLGSLLDETPLSSPGPLNRHDRAAVLGCHGNCNYNNNNNNCCNLPERYLTPTRTPTRTPAPNYKDAAANVRGQGGAGSVNNNSSGNPFARRKRHDDGDNNGIPLGGNNNGYSDELAATAAPGKHLQDNEQIHVLVTKPEIASKPKDHIIFEGDMDLKTTFETTYEALAKMRLDHWRRHQEVAGVAAAANKRRQGGGAEPSASESVSVDNKSMNRTRSVVAAGSGQQLERGRRHYKQRDDHFQRFVKRETTTAAEAGGSRGRFRQQSDANAPPADEYDGLDNDYYDDDDADDANDQIDHGQQQQARRLNLNSNAKSPGAASSGPGQQTGQVSAGVSLEPSQSRHTPTRATPPTLVSGSPISRKRMVSPAHHQPGSSQAPPRMTPEPSAGRPAAGVASRRQLSMHQQKRQQSQPVLESNNNITTTTTTDNNNYIDPDLSPIIVYDANLNRLERVGIRRRSKYRPSTSLRLGAGGLFGDGPAAPTGGQNDGLANSSIGQNRNIVSEGTQTQSGNRDLGAGASSKEMDRYMDMDVSGKKHLLGHAGRRDHIKEEEVARHDLKVVEDKSTLTEERLRGESEAAAAAEVAAELRLAEEEESAAVAEIQRCTRSIGDASESAPPGHNEPLGRGQISATITATPDRQQQQLASTGNGGGRRTDSRQSRQQRTCQNQSFYIFENEYPQGSSGAIGDDYCIKIGGRESADMLSRAKTVATTTPVTAGPAPNSEQQIASPFGQNLRTAKGKNLFRESPDFILTTGAGTGPRAMQQNQTSGRGEHQRAGAGANNYRTGANEAMAHDGHFSAASDMNNETTIINGNNNSNNNNISGCRVLNLDNNFEFVGLKSGHKYFVEKQSELATRGQPLLAD